MKLGKLKDNIMLLFFFPVYFSIDGIYKYTGLGETPSRGLILPFTVILGIYSILCMAINNLKLPKVRIQNKLLPMIVILVYLIIMHTLLGYGLFNNLSSILLNLQYLSGILGIYISIYLINYRKLGVEKVFYYISVLFLLAIISNISISILKVGFTQTFSRNIYRSTFLGGIYHVLVYYPFIVSIVFLFALPFWERNKKLMFPVYLLVTIYVISLQVRGAIISYLLGLIIYFLKFSRKNKIVIGISLILMIVLVINLLPTDILFGRFLDKNSSFISGREKIWKVYIENLSNDPLYIIRGSYSKASTSNLLNDDPFKRGLHSYHNQYIEIIDSYGIFILILFLSILVYYLLICFKKVKHLKLNKDIYYYWITLVILHFVIDLNVNVPIRVTNPAIIYLFYWTSIYLTIQNTYNAEIKNK